jgi:GNAT superfamily N-acetyltransferase
MIWRVRNPAARDAPFIRWGRRADATAVAAMSKDFRAELGEATVGLTEEAYLRDGFGRKREFEVLVADAGREPAGYAVFFESYEPNYSQRGLYLADLYVRPEHRNSGLGRMLLSCVVAESRRRGRTFVWWVALATNTSAHAFYEHLGAPAIPIMAHAAYGELFEKLAASSPPIKTK